jgi:hypothetical protein
MPLNTLAPVGYSSQMNYMWTQQSRLNGMDGHWGQGWRKTQHTEQRPFQSASNAANYPRPPAPVLQRPGQELEVAARSHSDWSSTPPRDKPALSDQAGAQLPKKPAIDESLYHSRVGTVHAEHTGRVAKFFKSLCCVDVPREERR